MQFTKTMHRLVDCLVTLESDYVEESISDVVYSDDDVCVLDPLSNRGVVVYHTFEESVSDRIGKEGLKVHAGSKEHGRIIDHPYLFFRAPGKGQTVISNAPTWRDIACNYVDMPDTDRCFMIRIDPSKTFVYYSEIRVNYMSNPSIQVILQNSRKPLVEYLDIINENSGKRGNCYNLFSYQKTTMTDAYLKRLTPGCNLPFTICPPEINAEILIRHDIPPEWRVHPMM